MILFNPFFKHFSILSFILLSCLIPLKGQVVVDSSDKVAIGHLVPAYDLHVKAEEVAIQNKSGVNRMFIDSSGFVGIGTTSPDHKLHVHSGGNTYLKVSSSYSGGGAYVVLDNTGDNSQGRIFFTRNSVTAGGIFYNHNTGGSSQQLSFDVAGGSSEMTIKNQAIGVATTSPSYTLEVAGDIAYTGDIYDISDQRLKRNIEPFQKGLNEVLQLDPVYYTYNGLAGINFNEQKIGLLAQNLQEVAPELVKETELEDRDNEGNFISSDTFLTIKSSQIKYLLINAIKELKEEIDLLKDQPPSIASARSNSIAISLENAISDNKGFLSQSMPNPTSDGAIIPYYIPENSQSASIRFFNLNGQVLKEVNPLQFGVGQIEVETRNLISGQYIYHLTIDGKLIDSKSMTVAN